MFEINYKIYEPADISIYLLDKGLVLKEKSLLAYEKKSGKIVAVGTEAEYLAKNPRENILICSPLRQGVVADYIVAVKLFTWLLQKACGKKPFRKPGVAICVPPNISEVEKKAVEDAVRQAGAGELIIADIPMEQFLKEMPEKLPKLYRKFKVIIGISKDDPESYLREQLSNALDYAAQAGISAERVGELLKSVD